MIRTLSRLLLVIAATAQLPSLAHAQATPVPRAGEASTDTMPAQDRDALTVAEQLAADASQLIEQWLRAQSITEDRLFARMYFPVAKTEPLKYTTPYTPLADRDLPPIEDRALAHATTFQYAILTDVNGYVPAHNTRFSQPLTGNPAEDYVNNRTKRMLGDATSMLAGRNEARYLIQRVKLETGEVIYDLSVPVTVRGKHWGCVRIGYRRNE